MSIFLTRESDEPIEPIKLMSYRPCAAIRGHKLQGFLLIRACNSLQLRTLFLEDSSIIEKYGRWIHEIAMNNSVLETLNFYMTDLVKVDLVGFFHAAAVLEEFNGGSFYNQLDGYAAIFSTLACKSPVSKKYDIARVKTMQFNEDDD
ncbi:hypothetical protein GOBAR_DD12379 [Gossypium barbadense]|nr:hypothetical protein GOBAR_DD12379 [Gossypium barbadense]